MASYLEKELRRLQSWPGPVLSGRVDSICGLLIEAVGTEASIGELCYVFGKGDKKTPCEVVGFKGGRLLLMTLGDLDDIKAGAEVYPTRRCHSVGVSEALLGRILDAFGNPIDNLGPLSVHTYMPSEAKAPPPMQRGKIDEIMLTKIRAIDGLMTIGKGQRIGIFSKAGVGKSTLIGMIAKQAAVDVNVIALVGERGREVKEFIESELGKEGLSRSVVVVATADTPALERAKAASVATAIAEYFRALGKDVTLMMDSVSRYGAALREIGLSRGEPPAKQGFPPSVFAKLPYLLERAGKTAEGSITGIYTILNEEDEMSDPISDQMRSLLDGHIVLSRELSEANHFPAIDVLASLSRLMPKITDKAQLGFARKLRQLLHSYNSAKELINIGAYAKGSDEQVDEAIAKEKAIRNFLCQESDVKSNFAETLSQLKRVVQG